MNQIAIGDPTSWTVLEGQSIAAPYKRAAIHFTFSAEPTIKEKVTITLAGTTSQISAALITLETVIQNALAYADAAYPSPQYLRFQPESGGDYYYTPLSDLYLEANSDGYLTRQTGSVVISLHYTRPNHFDSDQVELPLSGRGGTNVTGGYTIYNHTDYTAAHGNTALIAPADVDTEMPAPLRIEYENIESTGTLRDVIMSAFHHPSHTAENPFFHFATDFVGGTAYMNTAAINDYYRRLTWTTTPWTALTGVPLSLTDVNVLDGRMYRPIVHLYAAHAYTDLFMKLKLERGVDTILTCEPIWADPSYRYLVFPPVQVPPNRLLREMLPHHVEFVLYAQKTSGSSYTIEFDCLTLFPLDYAANFVGFFNMGYQDKLIYDSFREVHNVRYSAAGSETVAHVKEGGPMLLYPASHTRLFFMQADSAHLASINRRASIRVYYRKRKRLL